MKCSECEYEDSWSCECCGQCFYCDHPDMDTGRIGNWDDFKTREITTLDGCPLK